MVGGDRPVEGRERGGHDREAPGGSRPACLQSAKYRHYRNNWPDLPPGQPVRGRAPQQGGADQPEQGQPVGLTEDRQTGDPDEPGVRHQQRDAQALPGLGERQVQVAAYIQHRPERQRGAAEPEQQEQPRVTPPPGGDQAEHREQAQHHAERVQRLQARL